MKSERARLSLSHYGHVAAIFSLVLFKRMSEYWCKNPVPKKILKIDVCTLMSLHGWGQAVVTYKVMKYLIQQVL